MLVWAVGFWRLALPLLLLATTRPAMATYSIVASDRETREVGGAATSCLSGSDVYVIYGTVPSIGVVHAQATVNQDGRLRAIELLRQGAKPSAIVDEITSLEFDPNEAVRQYAVVGVSSDTAGFTGARTRSYAADVQGQTGSFSYSVQGNVLTSGAVLTQAASAFEAPGCDLADRLMRALEAGAQHGEGDSRCTPLGIPSDSAYLEVDRPGEDPGAYLELRVPTSGDDNPLDELRAAYDD